MTESGIVVNRIHRVENSDFQLGMSGAVIGQVTFKEMMAMYCKKALTVMAFCMLAAFTLESAGQDKMFVIVHDEDSIDKLIPELTEGDAKISLETEDVYKGDTEGKAALKVTGNQEERGQKYRANMPDWQLQIVANPTADHEFRYVTFAWKKVGGDGIQLQFHGEPDGWWYRYHAGPGGMKWNAGPSIEVNPDLPEEWEIHTRDLFDDWGEWMIDGIAFTAWNPDHGIWDHVVLHQSPEDPLPPLAVEPREKLTTIWAELKAP